jgi:hypothetical protein
MSPNSADPKPVLVLHTRVGLYEGEAAVVRTRSSYRILMGNRSSEKLRSAIILEWIIMEFVVNM